MGQQLVTFLGWMIVAVMMMAGTTGVNGEIPDQQLSQTIETYERVVSHMEGFTHKYFAIPKASKTRYLKVITARSNDTISLSVSNEYKSYPDRNHTWTVAKDRIGWVESGDDDTPHGDGIYTYTLDSFDSDKYPGAQNNISLEIQIRSVWCPDNGNITCQFTLELTQKEFPLLYMMLGILGGVGCCSLYIVSCCACFFFWRDRIIKMRLKKAEKKARRKETEATIASEAVEVIQDLPTENNDDSMMMGGVTGMADMMPEEDQLHAINQNEA